MILQLRVDDDVVRLIKLLYNPVRYSVKRYEKARIHCHPMCEIKRS